MPKIYLILAVLLFLFTSISAQIPIESGNTVKENFDGMGTSTTASLPGGGGVWKADQQPQERTLGSFSIALIKTKQGGANLAIDAPGGIYNFGAGTGNGDRCVGGLATTNIKTINLYLYLQNNGTTPIPSLYISYVVEKYKRGTNTAGFTMQLYYSYSGTASSWISAGSDFQTNFLPDTGPTGNIGYTPAPGGTTPILKVLTLQTNILPGSPFYLAWSYSFTSPTNNVTNAQALGIDSVSITALSGHTSPLPASLLRFTGERKADKNLLLWSTATEVNNKGFELQRSADGNAYQPIGFINSSASGGNSVTSIDYTFNDYDITGEKQFYRLKQIDLEGKVNFSPVVLIQDKKIDKITIVDLYPNPASGTIALTVDVPVRNKLTCSIMNITGHISKQVMLNAEAGTNVFRVDISDLHSGIYYLKCVSPPGTVTMRKFIVQ